MKLFAAVLGLASVLAVPLSKAHNQAECCLVDPLKPSPDGCRCFGDFKPSGEHQQCMTASPQFKSDRLKRAWQAGCWCIDETVFCQDFCTVTDPLFSLTPIRVLKVDIHSGENDWIQTTVADAVSQPVDVTDTDARTQCFSGCESRGFCRTEIAKAWPKLTIPQCPPLPTLRMSTYKGDANCKAGGILEYNQKCFIEATAGNWCKTNTIACVPATEEANALVYNIAEDQECFPITLDPTHAPSRKPTKQPTEQPTAEPTPSPTMQPIDNPTVMGCNKYNSLPTSCSADSADKCSYDAGSATCESCSTWDGQEVCKTSTECGLSQSSGQCLYCADVTAETDCTFATGCQWTGTVCLGTN